MDTFGSNPLLQQEQITIERWEYPQQFQTEQYDAVLIYTVTDQKLAEGFRYILQNYISLADGRPPKLCLLDYEDCMESSQFASLGEAIKRSTYMLMLVTEEFCWDRLCEIHREECLMETVNNPEKRWCAIPIITHKSVKELPFGLRALKPLNATRIFKRNSTLTVESCAHLNPLDLTSEIDTQYLKSITGLLNNRLKLKREREDKQAKELERWVQEEKKRRWQKLIEEENNRKVDRQRREFESQKFLDAVQAGIHNQIPSDIKGSARQPVSSESTEDHRGPLVRDLREVVVHNHYHAKRIININGPVSDTQFGENNQIHRISRNSSESSESSECEYVVRVEASGVSEDRNKVTSEIPSKAQVTLNKECSFPSLGAANEAAVVPTPLCSSPQCDVKAVSSSTIFVSTSSSPDQSVQPPQRSFPSRLDESEKHLRQPVVAVIGPTFIAQKNEQDKDRNETAVRHSLQDEADEETAVKQRICEGTDVEAVPKLQRQKETGEESALKQRTSDESDEETAVKQRICEGTDVEAVPKLQRQKEAGEESAVKQRTSDEADEETAVKRRMSDRDDNESTCKMQPIDISYLTSERTKIVTKHECL